jgi:CDP-L-myo-inositol myo-inositolphosphotransferase
MTETITKGLVQVNKKPLLAYSVAFAKLVGCDEIIVVTGAFSNKVQGFLKSLEMANLRWVENKDYLIGNLYSLGAAREEINDDFILMNTDHVYHRDIAAKVKAACLPQEIVAFTDNDRQIGADDMKVALKDNRLHRISKQLDEFDLGYVGMTFCSKDRLSDYFEAFDRVVEEHGDKAVVEMVLGELAKSSRPPIVGDISNVGWHEIDTPEEHAAAEENISKNVGDFESIDLP